MPGFVKDYFSILFFGILGIKSGSVHRDESLPFLLTIVPDRISGHILTCSFPERYRG